MKRRPFLLLSGLVLGGAGCLENPIGSMATANGTPAESSDFTDSPSRSASRTSGPSLLTVVNHTPDPVMAAIRLRHEPSGEISFFDTPTIPSDSGTMEARKNVYSTESAFTSYAGGDQKKGAYELAVSVRGGPSATFENAERVLDVGDHDRLAAHIEGEGNGFAVLE